MKKTFNASEVASELDVSVRTITRHIKDGKLDAVKPGRAYVISRSDLADYLGGMERVEAIFGEVETEGSERD